MGPEGQIEFQEVSSIPSSTETTVLSFTNTGGVAFAQAIGGTASARSEWFVYKNTDLILKRRISTAYPVVDICLNNLRLNTGDILDVKVAHYESSTQDFQCELRYF